MLEAWKQLVLVAFVAHVIALELGRKDERSYATVDVLDRASAQGSSGQRRDLEEGARKLALLEQDLMLTARDDGGAAAGHEPKSLGSLLRSIANGIQHASVGHLDRAADAQVLIDPYLFHRAVTHLSTLLQRGGAPPIELTTRAEESALVVGIQRAAELTPPANNLDRAGTTLGEWLATQLLAVSEATLERDETTRGAGYLVRIPLR